MGKKDSADYKQKYVKIFSCYFMLLFRIRNLRIKSISLGLVIYTTGCPLDGYTHGGSFLYHMVIASYLSPLLYNACPFPSAFPFLNSPSNLS